MMQVLEGIALVFLAGITFAGVSGSLIEFVFRVRLSFEPAFIHNDDYPRVLAPICAGPLMLVNDALDAWRERCISTAFLISCMCIALMWTSALGVAMVELTALVTRFW
jgi:hypothetical protein